MGKAALAIVVFLLAPTAGCLTGTKEVSSSPSDKSEEPKPDQPAVRTIAASNGSTSILGLAVYEGIDPAAVQPHVPGNMTPVSCLPPDTPGTVDVTLITEKRTHDSLPGGDQPVKIVALIGCAKRPDGLAREHANEPPWVQLMGWVDGDAYVSFFESRGFPVPEANVSLEQAPRGYTLSASRDGQGIVEARFVTSPVGTPDPAFYNCTASRQDGRSIAEGPNGSLVALDWNKTEAICPAQAEITWPMDSPIADVLGPARSTAQVVDTRVEEARYWWRDLPDPGGGQAG